MYYVLYQTRKKTTMYSIADMSNSTKVKEFELIFFLQKITQLIWIFLNFNFNSEQLTAINHSSRQENLRNNACVGLL